MVRSALGRPGVHARQCCGEKPPPIEPGVRHPETRCQFMRQRLNLTQPGSCLNGIWQPRRHNPAMPDHSGNQLKIHTRHAHFAPPVPSDRYTYAPLSPVSSLWTLGT